MPQLVIEQGEEKTPHECTCCGMPVYDGYGFITRDGSPHAVYFATWSPGHADRGVWLALVLGDWSDSAGPDRRRMATMLLRAAENQHEFSFTDTSTSPWANSGFALTKL